VLALTPTNYAGVVNLYYVATAGANIVVHVSLCWTDAPALRTNRRYEADNERTAGEVPATTRREIRHEMSTAEQQRDDVIGWLQRLTDVIDRTTVCSRMA